MEKVMEEIKALCRKIDVHIHIASFLTVTTTGFYCVTCGQWVYLEKNDE